MEYRTFNKNLGKNVSNFAINGMTLTALSQQEIYDFILEAKNNGINVIDVYMTEPWARINIGKALKDFRDDFSIIAHLGSIFQEEKYIVSRDIDKVSDALEELLIELQTDFVDFGVIHDIKTLEEWKEIKENGFLEFCVGLKNYGKIKHIGFSSQSIEVIKEVIKDKEIDIVLMPINLFYDIDFGIEKDINLLFKNPNINTTNLSFDNEKFKIYSYCQQNGIAIFGTEIFGDGALLFNTTSPFKKSLTVFEYALDRLGVVSLLIDFNDKNQMKEILSYFDKSDFDKNYVRVLSSYNMSLDNCLYCNNCLPCPKNINIGKVARMIDCAYNQEILSILKKCNQCGKCEINCPFGVEIVKKLTEAKK